MIFLIALACSKPVGESDPVDLVAELTARGPYGVGFRQSEITYADTIAGGERTLRLASWWPSDDTIGAEVEYRGIFPAPGVWLDASVAAGSFPVVVFSHGHQGFAENSGFLMAHLASHGFLVFAPDHTGNTFVDGSERTTGIYAQRPLDISAVLDAIPADPKLAGAVGEGRIGIGHSFGGYTAFALAGATYDEAALGCGVESGFCSTMTPDLEARFRAGFAEPRFDAIVSMAPGDFDLFGAGLGAHAQPILHMIGDLDPNGANADAIWAAVRKDGDLHVELVGGGHQTFTDFSGTLGEEEFEGLIDVEEGFRIIDAYALAWARFQLGDESVAPVLDGSEVVSTRALLER